MNTRTRRLALSLVTVGCTGVALAVMPSCLGPDNCRWLDIETVVSNTSSDLLAVTALSEQVECHCREYFAVGAGGTVVVLSTPFDESSSSSLAIVHQVGTATLRAVAQVGSESWVVGDVGTAAYSIDRGANWTTIDLGVTATLRGVVGFGDSLVVIGDGVVVARSEDGTWSERVAPDGDWPAAGARCRGGGALPRRTRGRRVVDHRARWSVDS